MIRKPLVVVAMLGIGYLFANTPSVWKAVVYSMPILSFCLLLICIRAIIRGGGP